MFQGVHNSWNDRLTNQENQWLRPEEFQKVQNSLECQIKDLMKRKIQPEEFIEGPNKCSFLHLICMFTKHDRYLQWVLSEYPEANINQENPYSKYATPLHFAVMSGNFKGVQMILKIEALDVNAIMTDGNNALHCLMESPHWLLTEQRQCLKLFLDRDELNVNHINRCGKSPLMTAVDYDLRELVETLIESKKVDLLAEVESREIREIIREKFGIKSTEKEHNLKHKHVNVKKKNVIMELFMLLYKSKEAEFITSMNCELSDKNNFHLLNCTDGWQSYLQLACEMNLKCVYTFLLDKGCGQSGHISRCPHPPAHLLTKHPDTDLKIFIRFRDCDYISRDGDTVLHYFVDQHEESIPMRDLLCNLLLSEVGKQIRRNIDRRNNNKETALYIAIQKKKLHFAHYLLRYGAFLGSQNEDSSKNPLKEFPEEILRDYLDSLVSENNEERYGVRLDYSNILLPGNKITTLNTMIIPRQIAVITEVQQLVMHPVISSLVLHEWVKINPYFFINFLFSLLFMISIYLYIRSLYTVSSDFLDIAGKYMIWISLPLVIVREVIKLIASFESYFRKVSNWLSLILYIVIAVLLIDKLQSERQDYFCIIAIILCYSQLLYFTNQSHIYVAVFRRVCKNYTRVILWYVCITLGFSLIFFIVFGSKSKPGDENGNSSYFFRSLELSIFYTILLNLGNVSIESIHLEQGHNIFAYLLVLLFLFLMAVIFMNVLNGFAVADTQDIIRKAEFYVRIKQVKYIVNFDKGKRVLQKFLKGIESLTRPLVNCLMNNERDSDVEITIIQRHLMENCEIEDEEEKDGYYNIPIFVKGEDNSLLQECKAILAKRKVHSFHLGNSSRKEEIIEKITILLKELSDL